MQVTVTVSDEIARQAVNCGKNIVEYVESLIDEGQRAKGRPALQSAIDHIRALRSEEKIKP
jgi:predicted  nucleic acid-binding Zn-ribbon protein